MFDKLVTVNYRRGLGGEFFCYTLDKSFSDREFVEDTNFGTFNRYEYVGIDFIFRTYVHHFFWITFYGYESAEEYVDKEYGYPSSYNVSLRKGISIKKMEGLIQHFNMYIKDPDPLYQLQNIKEYIEDRCRQLYVDFLERSGDSLAVSNLHYDNTNRFNVPVGDFFKNSKNICLVNNSVDEYFYTLLWIYKRLPDLKYYPAKMKSAYKHSKEKLLDYFKFQKRKEYKVFDGEFGVEAFDFHYRGLNIDRDLSDYLGVRVSFDYDRVKWYGETNRQLMIDNFDVDVFKDYTEEQICEKFARYLDRVYDEI